MAYISYQIGLRWMPLALTDEANIGSDNGFVPSRKKPSP